jgi:3-oxoacyl-[acyl-carrier protein] reductase
LDLGLTRKRALVTGGAPRGLGKAIAAGLRAEGAVVAICAREPNRVKAAAEVLGASGLVGDLSASGAGEDIARRAIDRLGGIDILARFSTR